MHIQSELVNISIEMRKFLTGSHFGLNELRRIYLATPVSDYFYFENKMCVQRKKKLLKRNFYM